MYVIVKVLLISLLVVGCQNANIKDKNQLVTFNLKELPKITTVKLSDLGFVDIEYIPLETNASCTISMIQNLKVGDSFFLVQFYNTIFKFQNNGSFLTKIGTVGRGPNEFLVAHDIDIDKANQNIYLVDGRAKKFNVYSGNGEFIRTFKIPLNGTISFRFIGDHILCYTDNHLGNVEYSYIFIDTDGRIIKKIANKYNFTNPKGHAYVFENENLFYEFNNHLFKKEVYSDTVYSLKNLDFEPHMVIRVGNKLITPKARSEFEGLYIIKKYITPENLFEFGDYIYYEFMYDIRIGSGNILYGFIGSKKDNFYALINSEQGLINDLDGGPNVWPKTIKDDNTIISWVDALQLKNYIASETFKNSTPKYPEKKRALEKMANNIKETDNPVLILVKLKK